MSLVGQNLSSISLFATHSRMKWCRMSICLAWECETELRDRAILPWLSVWMIVAAFCWNLKSFSNAGSQIASFAAFDAAIYSASTVERATVGCFLDDHETGLPAIVKTNPPTERLESLSWAQSESVHLTNSNGSLRPPRVSMKSAVPFKYLKTHFTASKCAFPELRENWVSIATAYWQSGLVWVAYNSTPTRSGYEISCVSGEQIEDCVAESRSVVARGVDTAVQSLIPYRARTSRI